MSSIHLRHQNHRLFSYSEYDRVNPTGLMKHVGLSVLLKTLIITGSCLRPWVLLSISIRTEIYLNKLFLYDSFPYGLQSTAS